MAFFGQQPRKDDPLVKPESRRDPRRDAGVLSPSGIPRRMEDQGMGSLPAKPSESILSAGLTIEGKIEGSGNVRVSGRFKGNINVKGEFTIEQGASIEGEVNADAVLVGGEVRGQIVASSRVEFREFRSVVAVQTFHDAGGVAVISRETMETYPFIKVP